MKNENDEKQAIYVNGLEKIVQKGVLVSEVLQEEVGFRMPCAGHGRCGKCKVLAIGMLSEPNEKEQNYLTEHELAQGIRLACQTKILGECTIDSLENGDMEVVMGSTTVREGLSLFQTLGAAIDIGTTTLAVSVYDKKGFVGQAGSVNPQVAYGADVISRIEQSLQGKGEQLAKVIRVQIADLLRNICKAGGYAVEEMDTLVITGNTAMLYLLTNRNPIELSRAPFVADWLAGEWVSAKELELGCPNAKVYLPHCISAFVGADITMALLQTDICKDDKKRLLVDIGTNGEVVLWTGKQLLCCSTAAGPAFEGTGLSMGMTASAGAISKVTWKEDKFQVQVIGNVQPTGICGSGVIDAIRCLLQSELMDETGFLEDEDVVIAETVTMTQEDIRKIQLAKSAICAGIESALHKEGISTEDLEELLVAGGFGSKIDLENAMYIGLLPCMDSSKIKVCGNAALAGAKLLLCNGELLEQEKKLVKISQSLNLATDSYFQDRYIEGMLFLADE